MKKEKQSWKPLIIYSICGAIVIALRISYLHWFNEPDVSFSSVNQPPALVAESAKLISNQTIQASDRNNQTYKLQINNVVGIISANFNTSVILARHWNQESTKTVDSVITLYNIVFPKQQVKRRSEIKRTFVSDHQTIVLQLYNNVQVEFTPQELIKEYVLAVTTQKTLLDLWQDCSKQTKPNSAKSCKQLIKATSDTVNRFNKIYID